MNIVDMHSRIAAVERQMADVRAWRDEIEILVGGGKSSVKTMTVVERDQTLHASKISVDERILFAHENKVVTVGQLQTFENKFGRLEQVTNELLQKLTVIISGAEVALTRAQRAETEAMRATALVVALCDVLDLSLEVGDDGTLTLANGPRTRRR